jgi:hypothetical protein
MFSKISAKWMNLNVQALAMFLDLLVLSIRVIGLLRFSDMDMPKHGKPKNAVG